jgi:long-chain acyl-CoA synthetase
MGTHREFVFGTYEDRPWLSLYKAGSPTDIAVEFRDVPTMWRASVARAGDKPLIHYFDSTCTLSEVDADSDGLAAALADRGIGRDDRVALYMQNVPQFMVAVLAVWKLGAIAVPVNPMLKERELAYVIGDSEAKALICLQELWSSVASKVVENSSITVSVTTSPLDYLEQATPQPLRSIQRLETPGAEDLLALIREYAGQRPEPVALSPDSVAALTYTSGTTGDPKAAMNTHGNVVFNTQVFRDWMGLTEQDVCLAVAPLFHITGLIGHAAVGMLVPMPLVLGYRFDPSTMGELAERRRATFTVMAITAYTAMMNDPSARERDLSSLSKVYSCGAPIAPSIVERYEREMGAYIHNTYGLTETTAPSHAVPHGRRAPVDPATGALSIGVPVFNNVVRIVDDNGANVPVGELGEIAIKGPGVIPGYWRKPEATAAALPGGELRTGDVGFMDEQGWFYVVDRKKDMINVSGYKVWPREVEDVLLKHPAVREAAVIGIPDEYRGESVKAFISLRPGVESTPEELIAFCKENMAAYKYPRQVEILDELPKTLTGKILRRNLRTHC